MSQDGLARKTHEASYMDLFWRAYLPNSRELPEEVSGNIQGRIVKSAQKFCMEQGPMRKVLLALALTTSGREKGKNDWVQRGVQLHGKALADVSGALKTKDRKKSNEILATIRYFGIYEVRYSTQLGPPPALILRFADWKSQVLHGSPTPVTATERGTHLTVQSLNWQAHIHGDLAIMHARGPSAFVEGDAHAIFVDGRAYLVSRAQHAEFWGPVC